ncbi:Gfo/Idh/MocA family protein [Roseibium sp. Sym1]|uniref:Gfo/Idh/MocA family protein n=1 Tax=Roseibium sp. Sym1 TaxID=3016006 RepID=UPI0022B3E552|nr:Gfo/Idh/MocA family oxidoreductase [Roseibium sp. Sym1]
MNKLTDQETPSGQFKVALVGMGNMGQRHARAFGTLPNVVLVGAVDTDPAKMTLISELGLRCFARVEDIQMLADAVVVATPAETHARIAVPFLEQGIHCLIEKPIALTERDAVSMMAAAEESGAMLAVGHSERFNRRLKQALEQLDGEAQRVEVVRTSCPAPSHAGADVVQDLMVHDLDWILRLETSPVRTLRVHDHAADATGLRQVDCFLGFDKRSYELRVSHVKGDRQRSVRISRPGHADLHYDLTRQEPAVGADPLERQAAEFVRFCKGTPSTIASGAHAVNVLALVERVRKLCQEHPHAVQMT